MIITIILVFIFRKHDDEIKDDFDDDGKSLNKNDDWEKILKVKTNFVINLIKF